MRLLKHKGVQSPVESVYIEEEPRESRKEFQTLFSLMPDPVVIVDGKGNFLAVNDKVEEKTGLKREELLGKNFLRTKIVTAKSKAILVKNLAKRMMGMHIEPYEIEALTKDGEKITFEVNATRIEYNGKPADIVIFRDITERKRMEEKLREQNIRLKRLDEMKSRFVSTATHELRTPVVSIKGYTELIRSGRVGEVPKRIDEMLEVVERNTNRLSKLTDDLLDQQRIESGRLKISPETLRLQDVTEEVIWEVKPTISEKGQTLHVKVPTDLPPVKADRVRISQVIINFLNNASKFTPEGGSISLKAREASDMVKVQVSDTGIGVAKEDLAKLFKPFPDIQKPSFYQGTGLGLSICRGIIGLHGGKIWAESEGRGKGATFTFTIPKHIEAE